MPWPSKTPESESVRMKSLISSIENHYGEEYSLISVVIFTVSWFSKVIGKPFLVFKSDREAFIVPWFLRVIGKLLHGPEKVTGPIEMYRSDQLCFDRLQSMLS